MVTTYLFTSQITTVAFGVIVNKVGEMLKLKLLELKIFRMAWK